MSPSVRSHLQSPFTHSTPVSAVTLSILRPTPVIPRAAAVGAAMQKDNKTSCRHSNTSHITTHTQHLASTSRHHYNYNSDLKPQTYLSLSIIYKLRLNV